MTGTRSIFITGAASGIGRATALLFARRGWLVGLADVDAQALTALSDAIGRERCVASAFDVNDVVAYRGALEAFGKATGGHLDVLFNNAGIARMGLNAEIDLGGQHRIVDTNLKAVLTGVALGLPLLRATPGAHIVTMSSASSLYGVPELAVYSATKHAVRGLTEALGLELERDGIVVCDIVAPYVRTPLVTAASRQAYSVTTTGVNLEPEQVAAAVWHAAHGKRTHWRVHPMTHVLSFLLWLLPFARRSIVKRLCLAPRHRAGAGQA